MASSRRGWVPPPHRTRPGLGSTIPGDEGVGVPRPLSSFTQTPPTAPATDTTPTEGAPTLPQLLRAMVERGASDLHVSAGAPPIVRVDGLLEPLDFPPLSPEDTRRLCAHPLGTEERRAQFEAGRGVSLGFGVAGLSRFRATIFSQRGTVVGVFRRVPVRVPTADELGLLPAVRGFVQRKRGLALVAGTAGSGRTSTLAALVELVNAEQRRHVLTVEDPIEYLHPHKRSVVNQLELHDDVASVPEALAHALRTDADVVVLDALPHGEPLAVERALAVAEAGRLVLAGIDAVGTIPALRRLLDALPSPGTAPRLAAALVGVTSQHLVPRADGRGRALAAELLVNGPEVRELLRGAQLEVADELVRSGRGPAGSQSLERALAALCDKGLVAREAALAEANAPEELASLLGE